MKVRKRIFLSIASAMLFGCALGTRDQPLTPDQQRTFNRLMASFEVKMLAAGYDGYKAETADYPPEKAKRLMALAVPKGLLWGDGTYTHKYAEAKEYIAFMQMQAAKWQRGEITWEELDYQILAKGNEISARFNKEFARESRKEEMERQTQALEALRRGSGRLPPPPSGMGDRRPGLGLLCRDAIERSDRGAMMVHCR